MITSEEQSMALSARLTLGVFSSCSVKKFFVALTRFASAAVLVLFVAAGANASQTSSWTGASDALWSNPNNWSPIGVPASGDSVAFPSGAAHLTNTNDLAG